MEVTIVTFPETPVAMLTHRGRPENEHDTVNKLVQWKRQQGLLDQQKYRHYGLHHHPETGWHPDNHQVDFCLSVDEPPAANDFGIVGGVIPACRCAMARDVGSRLDNQAVKYLTREWLPASGEVPSGQPVIFHYVNVGPQVPAHAMITDVYLPLND